MDNDDMVARALQAKRGSPFLNTAQSAAYLKISSELLKKLRTNGEGPLFRRHCRYVWYHIADLDDWSIANSARKIVP